MLKKIQTVMIAVLTLYILLPVSHLSASERTQLNVLHKQGNEIAEPMLKNLGIKEAQKIWGQVTPGPAIPLCDVNGNIIAYELVFALGKETFPSDEAVMAELELYKEELAIQQAAPAIAMSKAEMTAVSKKRWGVGSYGTIVMGARRDIQPVLEYHTGLPPYFTVLDEARARAAKALNSPAPRLVRIIAAGYTYKWFLFKAKGKRILVNMYSLMVRKPELLKFLAKAEDKSVRQKNQELVNQAWKQKFNPQANEASHRATTQDESMRINGVPSYIWTYGCSPTASAMVLGYWDTHGYSRLRSDGQSTSNFIGELATAMNTFVNLQGFTWPFWVDSGVEKVANVNRGYSFNCSDTDIGLYTPLFTVGCHWSDIKDEIHQGRPLVWTVGDYTVPSGQSGTGSEVYHSLCVFGYKREVHDRFPFDKWDCYALLYNTWDHQEHYWKVVMRSQWTSGYYFSELYGDLVIKIRPGYGSLPSTPQASFTYKKAGLVNSGEEAVALVQEQLFDSYPEFSWTSSARALKYEIYRKYKVDGSEGSWTKISDAPLNSSFYRDTRSVVNEWVSSTPPPYMDWVAFKVRAVDEDNRGVYSNIGYYKYSKEGGHIIH